MQGSHSSTATVTKQKERSAASLSPGAATFQWATWTVFVLQVWVLDFGRPVITFLLPTSASPFSWLSFSDCAHVAYIYLTALCLSRLQDHSSRQAPRLLHRLLLVTFVVGATIHLVADAVQQRLVRAGAKLHLPIHEQPLLQSADPVVVECFRFLDYLDEEIGHQIWYTALYLLFLLCFWSSFYRPTTNNNNNNAKPSPNGSIPYLWLLFASVLHEWYAITEAQVLPHFIATSLAMMGIFAWYRWYGWSLDPNGTFLLLRVLLTPLLVAVWMAALWGDTALRHKYRENWIYVPEPWSFASLYLTNFTH